MRRFLPFFEQSYVNVCNQLLDENVNPSIPPDRGSVELFNKLFVFNFFDEGRLLETRRVKTGLQIPSVNQGVGLCVQWVGVACNDLQVQWFNGFAVVRLEGVKLVENVNLCDLAEGCGVSLAHVDLDKFDRRRPWGTLWFA